MSAMAVLVAYLQKEFRVRSLQQALSALFKDRIGMMNCNVEITHRVRNFSESFEEI